MKPGDIVFWRDEKFGKHRFWLIEGYFLGCEGQESVVELRSLTERPGVPGSRGLLETTFVPEPLLRNVIIYTPDIVPRDVAVRGAT